MEYNAMTRITALLCCIALLSGCATYDRYSKYIPDGPITLANGGAKILYVLELEGRVVIHNPFAEASTNSITKGTL